MSMQILVPLDGSRFSEQALPIARGIAGRAGGALQLTHVHAPNRASHVEGTPVVNQHEVAGRTNLQTYLEQLEQRLEADELSVTTSVLEGPVAASIVEQAARISADLIVITTHGHGGLARLWLGSTADALVRHSHIPILLLRPADTHGGQAEAKPIRRIAIPLDGSAMAEQVLGPALTVGKLFDADYTLIRVVDVVGNGGVPDMVRAPELEHDMVQRRVDAAQRYLDGVAERLRSEGVHVETRVQVELQPAQAILREVETQGYDLVAMATHGRGGLPRLLLGSVADKVVRGTTIPVLVYHPLATEHTGK